MLQLGLVNVWCTIREWRSMFSKILDSFPVYISRQTGPDPTIYLILNIITDDPYY